MSHNVDWQACSKCGYWTKKSTDSRAKYYAGYCPAKLRDQKEKSGRDKNAK